MCARYTKGAGGWQPQAGSADIRFGKHELYFFVLLVLISNINNIATKAAADAIINAGSMRLISFEAIFL